MYIPDLATFQKAYDGRLFPVFRELRADLETPVSVFLKLCHQAPSFLLESVEKGEQVGRYSFIGNAPSLVLEVRGEEAVVRRGAQVEKVSLSATYDPLHLLRDLLQGYQVVRVAGMPRFMGGAVGYLGYDTVRYFEDLPPCPRDELGLPDAVFMFVDTLVIFDHVKQQMKVLSCCHSHQEGVEKIEEVLEALASPLLPEELSPLGKGGGLISDITPQEYMERVRRAKEYILAGDVFQVVLSHRLRRQTQAHPFAIYRALRRLNPSPYMFYMDFGPFQLVGSSPEMLVRLEGRQAETRPIAGTRPRGRTPEEDEATGRELLADPKERAEHVMLVDLGRNDLGRVCRFGTVVVPLYMGLEKYSHVIHIVSSVQGEMRKGEDAFSLLRSCFPAGTLTGAPKIRAMEIITEMEGMRRGPYGGAVGYFGFDGSMDTCITIRTIVKKGDTVYLQGGAGIVADSRPEREYEESMNKMEALARAVEMAEAGI